MTDQPRRRGRPIGTGKREDEKILLEMADLLIANPNLKRTAAIKQCAPNDWTSAMIHRVMGKWRKRESELLAAAEERKKAAARAQQERRVNVEKSPRSTARLGSFSFFETARQSRTMQLMEAMSSHPVMNAARALQNDPVMRAAGGYESGSIAHCLRQMEQVHEILRGTIPGEYRDVAINSLAPTVGALFNRQLTEALKGVIR